jgi:hypothetical protein
MGDTNSTSGKPNASVPPIDPWLLEHVVDETEEVNEWIHTQFVNGSGADSILAELIANGWRHDDAEGLVEEGRRATRHLRGVITREEVARVAEKRYRSSFRMAFYYALGGVPLMCAQALWSLLTTKGNRWPDRVKRRRREMDETANAASPDSDE